MWEDANRTIHKHAYTYTQGKLHSETHSLDNTTDTHIQYFYGLQGVAGLTVTRANETQTYHYTRNGQGDITHIYTANKQLVARYVYDAFGNHGIYDGQGALIDITDNAHPANLNPYRYRGYYYDTQTNFYYLKTRYYDPTTGRFISADNIETAVTAQQFLPNGLNLYLYCFNDPINTKDENGDMPEWLKVALGVVIVVAVVTAVALTAGLAGAALGAVAAGMIGLSGTAATAAVGMTALAMGSAALVTGLGLGFVEMGNQMATKGVSNMNLGSVAIMAGSGAINGALDGMNFVGKVWSKTPGLQSLGYGLKIGASVGKIGVAGLTAAAYGKSEGYTDDKIKKDVLFSMGIATLGAAISWVLPAKRTTLGLIPWVNINSKIFSLIIKSMRGQ